MIGPDDDLLPSALLAGYEKFLAGDFRGERETFHDLAEKGQHPHTLVIGCCDSRVSPEEIFNAAPGEIFDIRNVANLVPPFGEDNHHHSAWAAIDYAVSTLRVRNIVVLGHASCGGVRAFVSAGEESFGEPLAADDSLGQWLALLTPAARRLGRARDGADSAELLARESVKQALVNLRTFPKVAALEREGRLALHGAFFGIEDARLLVLDPARELFVQIAALQHKEAMSARF